MRLSTLPAVSFDQRPFLGSSQSFLILSSLGNPFVSSKILQISIIVSSPSPIVNMSIKSAMGRGLKVQGPPAIIIGSSSVLSSLR